MGSCASGFGVCCSCKFLPKIPTIVILEKYKNCIPSVESKTVIRSLDELRRREQPEQHLLHQQHSHNGQLAVHSQGKRKTI